MMGTVISVPSMGAARILLIPVVIQAPQQRNQRRRGKGRNGWHGAGAATAATFGGDHIWCPTEGRTQGFVCPGIRSKMVCLHSALCTILFYIQQHDSSIHPKRKAEIIRMDRDELLLGGKVERCKWFPLRGRRLSIWFPPGSLMHWFFTFFSLLRCFLPILDDLINLKMCKWSVNTLYFLIWNDTDTN